MQNVVAQAERVMRSVDLSVYVQDALLTYYKQIYYARYNTCYNASETRIILLAQNFIPL